MPAKAAVPGLPYVAADIDRLKVTVTKVNIEGSVVAGRDEFGTVLDFHFQKASEWIRVSPIEIRRTFESFQGQGADDFPLKVGEEVFIDWAANHDLHRRDLVRVVLP